jgi:hypothetical protein
MVSCTQLCAVLKGLTKAFILENGTEALLPARREPLGPDLLRRLLRTPKSTVLGTTRVDWNSTIFSCLGGMFALGGGTGFRKSQVALPSQAAFDDRRLSQASVLWLIDGTFYNGPSAVQLRSLVPGREFMLIRPPRSKADRDGTKFGALPIYLPFDPADVANAAHWIQRLELRFPRHGNQRRTTPLFFEDAVSFRPMPHATVGRLLKQLLRVELPEAEAANYCFHIFRIGFASALLAAGCPPATIQALACWSSAESLATYTRLKPSEYAGWVSKALLQRTDSTSTRNLPRLPLIVDFDIFATFSTASGHFDIGGTAFTERAILAQDRTG